MSLFGRLALLFVGVPLLELLLLIQMGRWVGIWPTVALVFTTGVAGAALARREGMKTLWKIQGELAQGHLPGKALLDGLAVLLGGALLLTPGVLTDVVGLSILFPPTRGPLMRRILRRLEAGMEEGTLRVSYFSGFADGHGMGQTPRDPSREIVVEPRGDSRTEEGG